MLKRIAQIFIIFIGFCSAGFALWFAILWNDTNSAFEVIEASLLKERSLLPAEATIRQVLFPKVNKNSMNAEDILAFDELGSERPDSLLNYAMKRKILAHRLRHKFSNDRLFLTWLSQEYFGQGHFGVEAISKALFDTEVSALTEEQAIAIAVLSRQPTLLPDNEERWHKMRATAKERLMSAE